MTLLSNLIPAYLTSDADAAAADLALNKIAYGADGKIIGTGSAGKDAVTFVAGTTEISADTGDNTITIDNPAEEGDLLLIVSISRNSYVGEPEGGGWTPVFVYNLDSGSNLFENIYPVNDQVLAWFKIAGASEPATFSFLINDDGIDAQAIQCMAFRNATQVIGYNAEANQTDAVQVWGRDGGMLVGFHGTTFNASTETSVTVPSSMTVINKIYDTVNDTGLVCAYEALLADELTGTRTWLASGWTLYRILGNISIF
jgi:hypothetical protein